MPKIDNFVEALREVLPVLESIHKQKYQFSCDHDGDECTCDEEARSLALIERIRKTVEVAEGDSHAED